MSHAATPAVTLLRRIASDDAAALREHLRARPPTLDDARWLLGQLLAPYAFHQLKAAGALPLLPADVRDFLQRAHRTMALHEATVSEAARAVLAALAASGVESVAMKGWALAHRAYPTPRCRPMGDLDLWVRGDARFDAIAVLEEIGY